MKLVLKKILIIIIALVTLLFAYKFAKAKSLLPDSFFSNIEKKIPQEISLPWKKEEKVNLDQVNFSQTDLEKLGSEGLSQVKILSDKAKEAGSVAQDFVEEVVQEEKTDDKNVSEKAFEYGRYIYCKEVVKEYEASNSAKK